MNARIARVVALPKPTEREKKHNGGFSATWHIYRMPGKLFYLTEAGITEVMLNV